MSGSNCVNTHTRGPMCIYYPHASFHSAVHRRRQASTMRASLRVVAFWRATTVLRPHAARLYSQARRPQRSKLLAAGGFVGAVTVGTAVSLAEYADTSALTWRTLLSTLTDVSHDISHSKRTTPGGARYELTIGANRSADMYSVLETLLSAFGSDDVTMSTTDAPSSSSLVFHSGPYSVDIVMSRIAAFDSHLTLTIETEGDEEPTFSDSQFRALITAAKKAGISHIRSAPDDVLAILDDEGNHIACKNPHLSEEDAKISKARAKLGEFGVEILDPSNIMEDWDSIAGYDELKRHIQDTLVLPLKYPAVYDAVVRGTRARFQTNVPKAVLYSGPPGCGKTMSARILASTIGVPFLHIPLEGLLSKFYGETTRNLASILEAANDLGRCIIMLDEVDSLAQSRSGEVHEVTRRTLSVLLRFLDGIDGPRDAILLAATNCADDIDAALLSRFDVVVEFPLPDLGTREEMLKLYARHLDDAERRRVARLAEGFSGREILDACEEAERACAGRMVRGDVKRGELPDVRDYEQAVRAKADMSVKAVEKRNEAKGKYGGALPRGAIAG